VNELGIIGDIHGHVGTLSQLLDVVANQAGTLVFLGDYVNRGPESAQVIDLLLDLRDRTPCVFIEGNHDLAFRAALTGGFDEFLAMGGAATVRSYVDPPFEDVTTEFLEAVPESHRSFLEQLVPGFEDSEVVVAHSMPDRDGSGRFRIGGHVPQTELAPIFGPGHACVDTGCGTIPDGVLTCMLWPSRRWVSVPVG